MVGISKLEVSAHASSHKEIKEVFEQLQQSKNAELEKEGIVYFGELSKSVEEVKAAIKLVKEEYTEDNQSYLYKNLKYVVKAKPGDSLECSLVKLATHKIVVEGNCEILLLLDPVKMILEGSCDFFLLDPVKSVVYGGDISPLCKALKKVVRENYVFLNIEEGGECFNIVNLFCNTNFPYGDILLSSSKLDVFLNNLKNFIDKGYNIVVDYKNYDPEKHSLLQKVIDENKESFITPS